MRKKLNRKLKFALAGFGAFALAGVSCVGLASLENHDAIASYAIDVPTDGNPVTVGNFTFSVNGSTNSVSWDEFTVHGFDETMVYICFYDTSMNILGRTSNYVMPTIIDGSAIFASNEVYSYIYDAGYAGFVYWGFYYFQPQNVTVNYYSSFWDSSEYVITGDSSPYLLELPPDPPTPVDYVHDIVDILVAGITKLGQGIGQGVSSFVTSLAFNQAGTGLSVYFVLVCVFGGIALAVALTSKIFMWLNGLGA